MKRIRLMVLLNQPEYKDFVGSIAQKHEYEVVHVFSAIECVTKLQSSSFDALMIDSCYIKKSGSVNSAFLSTLTKLAPVIVCAGKERKEAESAIRAHKIFYYLVKPADEIELAVVIKRAAKWNDVEKNRGVCSFNSVNSRLIRIFGMAVIAFFIFAESKAAEITVSVNELKNLSGNSGYDWVGAGFADSLAASLKNLSGIKVVEEIEMNKLVEGIKMGLTGFMDETSIVEKGRVLGAKYSVMGCVQIYSDRAIVMYRLVNMETREIMFCGTIKGKTKKLFELQEAVSKDMTRNFIKRFPQVTEKFASSNSGRVSAVHGDGTKMLECGLMDDPAEAMRGFEDAIRENPEFADGYLGIGELYMRQGEYFEALVKFDKALTLYKSYNDDFFCGWAYYKIGEAYFMQGYYKVAETNYCKALDYKKHSRKDYQALYIYQRLAEIAMDKQADNEAVEYLRKAEQIAACLKDAASRIDILVQLAEAYERSEDNGNALRCSIKACKLSEKLDYLDKDKVNEINLRLQVKAGKVTEKNGKLLAFARTN